MEIGNQGFNVLFVKTANLSLGITRHFLFMNGRCDCSICRRHHFLSSKFCVALLVMACWISAQGATVTWIGGSGDWDTTNDWSTGALPGPDDDVVIPSGPSITVTHSSGADIVNSIQSQQAFVLSGGMLTVSSTFQENNAFTLSGGTLQTATVVITNGASLVVQGGGSTLDGVTVNGVLDVGYSSSATVNLTVTNGLTLNGTALVGSATNRQAGYVYFAGSQSLGGNGTVIFGNHGNAYDGCMNTLALVDGGTTLTIGPGITIQGGLGAIGYDSCVGPGNVSVINQGTISADVPGGTIYLNAQPFNNQGVIGATNGGTLLVAGSCINSGSLGGSGGTVNFSGGLDNQAGTQTNTDSTIISGNFTNGAGQTLIFDAPGTITGFLDNQGGQVLVNGSNQLTLNGGTIRGGTVVATNGASLVVQGGGSTLDGVTVNGVLDVGYSSSATVNLTVTNGLTLNGTALVGSATNRQAGYVYFAGSQSLGGNGTVIFGNHGNAYDGCMNTLALVDGGTTLTIGPGITIQGGLGAIGYDSCVGPGNVSVINQGTISADVPGGTIYLNAQPFNNQGVIGATNGGTLLVAGSCINSGSLGGSGGTVNFSGGLDNQAGTQTNTDSTIISGNFTNGAGQTLIFDAPGTITGFLDNQGGQVLVNGSNQLTLNGGTIRGGTVVATNGASLVVQGGGSTLDGVTVNGVLDVGYSSSATVNLTVTNGLTLNGTALVGSATNRQAGYVYFAGSQSLGGNGTVIFGNHGNAYDGCMNTLALVDGGTTLTIGPGITIQGGLGAIGYDSCVGPGNVSVINQGTISANVAGGTIIASGQTLTNYGNLEAVSGSTVNWSGDTLLDGVTIISSQVGGTIKLGGNLLGNTRNADQYTPQGTLEFAPGSHLFEAMSQDLGNVANGYVNNFAYGTISLDSGAQVTLVDQSTNSPGPPPECVYADSLIAPAGSSLNLNGLHLYAVWAQIAGTITNGTVSQVPDNGNPLILSTGAPGNVSVAGAVDQFTFFGRAGEQVTIVVDTGSGNVLPPRLNYAEVQLFDPSTNLLSQASNTVAGVSVVLTSAPLPTDGTYQIFVRAPANQSASTGNFLVTVWDSTKIVSSLVINQQANGQISTPYSVDQWNFSATAGQQITFDLLNTSAPGVAFNLTGPNGWVGFSNLLTSSGLITLPSSGGYTLTAYSAGGQYDINFAFELVQTAETNLALGSTFTGQFVGSGQAQLIAIDVTNSNPLLISLTLGSAGNQVELYAKLGSPPTPSVYDFSYQGVASQTQDILIPSAAPGTWYILIYAYYVPQATSYSLQVIQSALILESYAPSIAGTAVNTVISIVGAGFDSNTIVQLVSTNATNVDQSIDMVSLTDINAFFPSNTMPAGSYTVCVRNSIATECLTNPLTVIQGGVPDFHASVIVPSLVGYHIPSTLYIDYANTGTAAMPAPLLTLTGVQDGRHNAIMTLNEALASLNPGGFYGPTSEPPGYSGTLQLLASGSIPGLLQPGESYQIPVYYQGWLQPWDFNYPAITFELGTYTAGDTSAIDWASYGTNFQPAGISDSQWASLLSGLESTFGSTWGSYVTTLDQLVSLTSPVDGPAYDANQLFDIAFEQLTGFGNAGISGQVIDVTTTQPMTNTLLVASQQLASGNSVVRGAQTGGSGEFVFPNLPPGTYQMSVQG